MVSLRGARLYRSDALLANALHFGSDFAGTIAVLAGLIAAALDFPAGDSIAGLFVSGLVVIAAVRLASRNVDVLMDRSPGKTPGSRAMRSRGSIRPWSYVLRLRRAAGALRRRRHRCRPRRHRPGHAAADRVEQALHDALPGIDVVVHVEPRRGDGGIPERALAAALTVSHVREIHNLTVLDVDGSIQVSLHLKLPGALPLDEAHDIAERVEAAILAQVPEVRTVQTHIEPLKEPASGEEVAIDTAAIEAAVREETGADPRELRFVRTDDGIVAFLTLGLGSAGSVADAHGRATAIEERVRSAVPAIADVVVHTEP